MALSMNTAANAIISRFHAENEREGDTATKIEWTGQSQFRDRQLWIELKLTEPYSGTHVTGWTNGTEEEGILIFEAA